MTDKRIVVDEGGNDNKERRGKAKMFSPMFKFMRKRKTHPIIIGHRGSSVKDSSEWSWNNE